MSSLIKEERAEKITSVNGFDVYLVNAEKFKTNTINVFFYDTLEKKNAARNALFPAVLRRGCEGFPTNKELSLYLEELYGASFDCGVSKKGEHQIIQFYIEFVSDKYTNENARLMEKAFSLLLDIITKPVLENGLFKKEYFQLEKENLKKLIESRVNDKTQYAVEKCFEEMCKEEPFGIYEYGDIGELNAITLNNLYEHYEKAVRTLPASVFITGSPDDEGIKKIISLLSKVDRREIKSADVGFAKRDISQPKEVTEKMSVNQSKLSLGFRTNVAPDSREYYKLMVYNGILGGGMHSKLFQNVREKASLAYYVFSRLEKFKGLMIVSSGIEGQNKEKAQKIIMDQIEEIRKGNISDYEFQATIKSMETGIKSLKDGQLQMVDFYLGQSILNTNDTLDSIIEKLKIVSREDVVEVARNISLDTVYFLTSNA